MQMPCLAVYALVVLAGAVLLAEAAAAQGRPHGQQVRPISRAVDTESLPSPDTPNPVLPRQAADPSIRPDMVGATVYDIDGAEVGEIRAVEKGRAIVSVGRSLGLGARDIPMGPDELIERGIDRRLITTLTRLELDARAAAP